MGILVLIISLDDDVSPPLAGRFAALTSKAGLSLKWTDGLHCQTGRFVSAAAHYLRRPHHLSRAA